MRHLSRSRLCRLLLIGKRSRKRTRKINSSSWRIRKWVRGSIEVLRQHLRRRVSNPIVSRKVSNSLKLPSSKTSRNRAPSGPRPESNVGCRRERSIDRLHSRRSRGYGLLHPRRDPGTAVEHQCPLGAHMPVKLADAAAISLISTPASSLRWAGRALSPGASIHHFQAACAQVRRST